MSTTRRRSRRGGVPHNNNPNDPPRSPNSSLNIRQHPSATLPTLTPTHNLPTSNNFNLASHTAQMPPRTQTIQDPTPSIYPVPTTLMPRVDWDQDSLVVRSEHL